MALTFEPTLTRYWIEIRNPDDFRRLLDAEEQGLRPTLAAKLSALVGVIEVDYGTSDLSLSIDADEDVPEFRREIGDMIESHLSSEEVITFPNLRKPLPVAREAVAKALHDHGCADGRPWSECADTWQELIRVQANVAVDAYLQASPLRSALEAAQHWLEEERDSDTPGQTVPDEILRVIGEALRDSTS